MVRLPLSSDQREAGRLLGAQLRSARGARDLTEVARAAGISPETLRKIETGRLPSPAFGTVVALSQVLDLSVQNLAETWSANGLIHSA